MKNMSEEMKKESIQEDEKKETVLDKEMSLKEIKIKRNRLVFKDIDSSRFYNC